MASATNSQANGDPLKFLTGEVATQRFTELLTGSLDTSMCWRVFADPADKRSERKPDGSPTWPASALEGTLNTAQHELHRLQKLDYGVYAVVNFGGARGSQITRVRAVFVDKDGGKHGAAQRWQDVQWHVEPDFLVVDPNDDYHWHAYWLVAPDFPIGRFTSTQKRLAQRYGSDPSVSDLSRVMRVPGFKHMKDRPKTRVLVDRTCGAACASVLKSLDAVTAGLPELRNEDGSPARQARPDFELDLDHNVAHARARLKAWKNAKAGTGNHWTYQAAVRAMDFGLSIEKTIEVVGERDALNPSPRPPEELEITVQNALAYRQNDLGCDAQDEPSLRFAASIAAEVARQAENEPEEFFDYFSEDRPEPFPLDILPPAVRSYVETLGKSMGIEPSPIAVAALTALSGCIDHGIRMKMLRRSGNFWVSACLWGLLVGDVGTKKSPILDDAGRVLRSETMASQRRFEGDCARATVARAEYNRQIKDLATKDEPRAAPQGVEIANVYWIGADNTIEAVSDLLKYQPRGVFLEAKEIQSWVGDFDKYGSHGGTRAVFLEARDGGQRTIGRKTGRVFIPNWSVSVLTATQPGTLAKIPDRETDGFIQRFLPCFMDETRHKGQEVDDALLQGFYDLQRQLLKLAAPADLHLDDEALAATDDFDTWLIEVNNARTFGPGFGGFLGKLMGLLGNLTVILHLAEHPVDGLTLSVAVGTVRAARRIIEEFTIPHMLLIHQPGQRKTAEGQRRYALATKVLCGDRNRYRASEIKRMVPAWEGFDQWELARAVSTVTGYLIPDGVSNPPVAWVVNPELRTRLAAQRDKLLAAHVGKRAGAAVARAAKTKRTLQAPKALVTVDDQDW